VNSTLDRYRPREKGDLRLSASTIRNWVRQVKRANGDYGVLRPQSHRPKHITFQVSAVAVGTICTLRHQLGWGGYRIIAELKARGIAKITGKTVYKVFHRLGLPIQIYSLKGKSVTATQTRTS
jgi:transposase